MVRQLGVFRITPVLQCTSTYLLLINMASFTYKKTKRFTISNQAAVIDQQYCLHKLVAFKCLLASRLHSCVIKVEEWSLGRRLHITQELGICNVVVI